MIKKRSEVNQKYKWKIEDIYENLEELEKDYNFVKNNLDFSKYQGKLSNDTILLECLRFIDELSLKIGFMEVYAMMKKDEDSSVSSSVSLKYKIDTLCSEFSTATAFFVPEVTAFSQEKLNGLIDNPKFADYNRTFISILKDKPHILSEESEKILAMGSNVFRSFRGIFDMIDNVDFPFPNILHNGEKITLSHGAYSVCLHDQDRSLRKKAFKKYYSAYEKSLNVITANYIASVNKDVFISRQENILLR